MAASDNGNAQVSLEIDRADDAVTLRPRGRLDAAGAAAIWAQATEAAHGTGAVTVDASGVEYCDGAGAGLLVAIRRAAGERFRLENMSPQHMALLRTYDPGPVVTADVPAARKNSAIEEIGCKAVAFLFALARLITFIGETAVAFAEAIRHPRRVRWPKFWLCVEEVGANGLPIVVLIGGLMGLIMAFQSIIILRLFGGEVYVPTMLAKSFVRELGPLVTAVILAGRTSSAFAAELGTMKVDEEIDALTTMGLDPVRFLVVVRVAAVVIALPLLTIFFDLAGVAGGALVSIPLGQPLIDYADRAADSLSLSDFLGSMFKALVLGFLVGGVGCHNGLRTGAGASAVGESATRAVVAGMVLIVVADGLFAVLFYALGI